MPPKRKTRSESGGILPMPLPDIPELHTNQDIISAMLHESELADYDIYVSANHVSDAVISKFQQINPRLCIIDKISLSTKIIRIFEDYKLMKRN